MSATESAPDLVALAERTATDAHLGATDKAGRAYISHPRRVADRVVEYGPDYVAVAWLHDVLEDTPHTAQDLLNRGFPARIVDAVVALTKLPGQPHAAAVERAAQDPLALVVKAADVADNASPDRLALLPPDLADRLRAKYATARRLLDQHGAPRFS